MQYRPFGKLDFKVSALGFGAMRLPVTAGGYGRVDEPEAIRIMRYAIDNGVNYIDTAYGYHGGMSEGVVGRALLDGYRAKVSLATKMPHWHVKENSDFERLLNEQLDKLQTEVIDFYLLHSLGAESWKAMCALDVLPWLEKARASGRIRRLGFSFHDNLAAFKEIVDGFAWDFTQIQYNYIDIENQAGTAGLKYAAERGLGVVVMEGLLGGRLVNPPAAIQAIWDGSPTRRSPADWALQWLWNQPEVSVVLSGMSSMQQVVENLASADASGVNYLSADELARVDQVRAQYNDLCQIPCTACDYCQPCPNKVKIPYIFELYNSASMYNVLDDAKREYAQMAMEERADMCLDCDECEAKCPQHIPISAWMPTIHSALRA